MITSPTGLRVAVLLGLFVLAATTAGCTLFADGDRDLPTAETVDERLDDLRTIEATIVSSTNATGEPTESRIRMMMRPGTGEFRGEMVGDGPINDTLVVSNATTMVMYNRTTSEAQVVDVEGITQVQNGTLDSMADIFAQLNEGEDVDTPSDVTTLPVVPGPTGGTTAATASLPLQGNMSLTYEGTDTVAGRTAYEIRAEPEDAPLIERYTLWIDAEWYYPIKTTGATTLDGETQSFTTVYRNVTFNPTVPEGTFEFDPPANVTVEYTANNAVSSFESRPALAEATNQTLPEPDLPGDYRFGRGSLVTTETGDQVSLSYTNGTEQFSVSIQPPGVGTNATDGESIEIDGREATVSSIGQTTVIRLPCDSVTYAVIGQQSRETLVDVAASLECR